MLTHFLLKMKVHIIKEVKKNFFSPENEKWESKRSISHDNQLKRQKNLVFLYHWSSAAHSKTFFFIYTNSFLIYGDRQKQITSAGLSISQIFTHYHNCVFPIKNIISWTVPMQYWYSTGRSFLLCHSQVSYIWNRLKYKVCTNVCVCFCA